MSYEENLDNMVNYFRKKNGMVMCSNIEKIDQDINSCDFRLEMYIDVSTNSSERVFDIKTIYLIQLKNDTISLNGEYRVKPKKSYKLSFGDNNPDNDLSSEEFLDVYMQHKGDMGDVYDSIKNNQNIINYLKSSYRSLYNSYELER